MNIWYENLVKPPFTPPNQFFPIAWGIIYTLIGISFLIILQKRNNQEKYLAMNFYLIQLVFNFLWTYLFFDLQSINLALIDVILLLIFLIPTIIYFFKLSKLAGWLLIPYLLQVIFALYLNFGLLILNT